MYSQIRNGVHISEHLGTCFRLTRYADYSGKYYIFLATWNTLDSVIKQVFPSPPGPTMTKAQFMATARE
jgi:hypothetical protein